MTEQVFWRCPRCAFWFSGEPKCDRCGCDIFQFFRRMKESK